MAYHIQDMKNKLIEKLTSEILQKLPKDKEFCEVFGKKGLNPYSH